jgi:hypothetical protein
MISQWMQIDRWRPSGPPAVFMRLISFRPTPCESASGQGSGIRGSPHSHCRAVRSWPAAPATVSTIMATHSQMLVLSIQIMSFMNKTIKNLTGPSPVTVRAAGRGQ